MLLEHNVTSRLLAEESKQEGLKKDLQPSVRDFLKVPHCLSTYTTLVKVQLPHFITSSCNRSWEVQILTEKKGEWMLEYAASSNCHAATGFLLSVSCRMEINSPGSPLGCIKSLSSNLPFRCSVYCSQTLICLRFASEF